jgi:hypothetical protein
MKQPTVEQVRDHAARHPFGYPGWALWRYRLPSAIDPFSPPRIVALAEHRGAIVVDALDGARARPSYDYATAIDWTPLTADGDSVNIYGVYDAARIMIGTNHAVSDAAGARSWVNTDALLGVRTALGFDRDTWTDRVVTEENER